MYITYIAPTCFGVQNTIYREHVMPNLKPLAEEKPLVYGSTIGKQRW
jgi:hypothetical protein